MAISHGALPEDLPEGRFDLIVFGEIGYYLETAALAGVCERLAQMLEPAGVFLAVHWLGTSLDHVLTGQQVHEVIGGTRGLARVKSQKATAFGWKNGLAGRRSDPGSGRGASVAPLSPVGADCVSLTRLWWWTIAPAIGPNI